jgi:hypothetical protein
VARCGKSRRPAGRKVTMFRRVNNAATGEEIHQIGEQYGIRVVPE